MSELKLSTVDATSGRFVAGPKSGCKSSLWRPLRGKTLPLREHPRSTAHTKTGCWCSESLSLLVWVGDLSTIDPRNRAGFDEV